MWTSLKKQNPKDRKTYQGKQQFLPISFPQSLSSYCQPVFTFGWGTELGRTSFCNYLYVSKVLVKFLGIVCILSVYPCNG